MTNEKLGAEVSKIDFTNSVAAAGIINDWVSKKTDGVINEIISPDMISEFSLMTLVTAILFKGKWVGKFQHAGKGVFWSLFGKTEEVEVQANFMRLDSSKLENFMVETLLGYYKDENKTQVRVHRTIGVCYSTVRAIRPAKKLIFEGQPEQGTY